MNEKVYVLQFYSVLNDDCVALCLQNSYETFPKSFNSFNIKCICEIFGRFGKKLRERKVNTFCLQNNAQEDSHLS